MSKNKKTTTKIGLTMSIYLRMLHQENNVSKAELARRYPQFAARSVYRHAGKPIEDQVDKRKFNKGRPRKLTLREKRCVINTLKRLRKETYSFTAKRLQEEANLTHVSTKSIRRVLHANGYHYLQSRKKGLLTKQDKILRTRWARRNRSKPLEFWTDDIKFYFDGVGFAHKTNPYAEARAPRSMAWRKHSEGLSITTKGKKEGSGGKMARFFVAIAYGKGVVLCKQYKWKVTGKNFASFVSEHFQATFEKCGVEASGNYFLQDGDPRQTSAEAKRSWDALGAKMFSIPARSPDLNPIENIFHLVRKKLRKDALEKKIVHETYEEFSQRVVTTIEKFSKKIIDKTIATLKKRINMVIQKKGERIKY